MFDFLTVSTAFAQESAASAAPQGNAFMSFVPFILIFVIFYFLMIRPQKKRLQEEKAMLGALQKGDEIFIKSGIFGIITGMTEKVVTLEIAKDVKVKVLRSEVGGKASYQIENQSNQSNQSK